MSNSEYPIDYRLGYHDGYNDFVSGREFDLDGIEITEVVGYTDGYNDAENGVKSKIDQ